MKLYKEQIGREFCAWDEDYPSEDAIAFDLSRDALFVMKERDVVIAAISIDIDEDVDRLEWVTFLCFIRAPFKQQLSIMCSVGMAKRYVTEKRKH